METSMELQPVGGNEVEKKEAQKTAKNIQRAIKPAKGVLGKRKKKKAQAKLMNDALSTVIMKLANTNHPSWYTKLGAELVNINYGTKDVLGRRSDILRDGFGHTIRAHLTTDAIIVVDLLAGSGDATRVAAQKIANELRLVSGANTIYDVEDIIDYILNARSIWAYAMQIRRLVQMLNAKDPYDMEAWNKYVAMGALHVDALQPTKDIVAEFRADAANVINWLNTMFKAIRFMIPSNMALMERTNWMFSNIFTDSMGKKFGSKMFVTKTVPIYQHSGQTHSATTYPFMGVADWATTRANLETMVRDFTTKQANLAIAGDLMKAYGMGSFMNPGDISYTEAPSFIYDEAALHQIQNADVVGDISIGTRAISYTPGTAPIVYETTSAFTLSAQLQAAHPSEWQVGLVNTDKNEVSGGDTLSLTRLKCHTGFTETSGNVVTVSVDVCGTEVVRDYLWCSAFVPGAYNSIGVVGWNYYRLGAAQKDMELSLWSLDDYAPAVVIAQSNPFTGNWDGDLFEDLTNWAPITVQGKQSLHTTAILSLMAPSASVTMQALSKL